MSQKQHSQPVQVATMKNGTSATSPQQSPQQLTMMTMVVLDNLAKTIQNAAIICTIGPEKSLEPPNNQPKHLPTR